MKTYTKPQNSMFSFGMRVTLVLVLALMFAVAGTADATSVLFFEDHVLGTSAVPGALSLLGLSATTVTTNAALNTQLTSFGPWDIVIFAEQFTNVFTASSTELTNYVNGGGLLLADSWLPTSGLDTLMEASAVDTNGTVITSDGHPIFAGLPATFNLFNPHINEFPLTGICKSIIQPHK